MAIDPGGTFAYHAVVPVDGGVFECDARTFEDEAGAARHGRLVGLAPRLRVSDAGLTPDAGPERPLVMRSEIRLTPRVRERMRSTVACFHVDRALMACTRAGDELYLVRTGCGGLGMSILRSGTLVVAAGAVDGVPLGRAISIGTPYDLVAEAEAVFKRVDPEFTLDVWPLIVALGDERMLLTAGKRRLGDYELDVRRGRLKGLPGIDPVACLYRRGVCPDLAAATSTMLMADPLALELTVW